MDEPPYWFRAKRYGWGWGLPVTWQGWAFFLPWVLLLFVGARFIIPWSRPAFWIFLLFMVGLLVYVCRKKGEPPGWRWGG